MAPSVSERGAQKREATSATTGLRIITVWNQCGGSGKTTIAINLAYEPSRRGIRTLLIGLGVPDFARVGMPPSQRLREKPGTVS